MVSEMIDLSGPPPPADEADADAVIAYRGQSLRFAPFGGRMEAKLRSGQFYEGEMLHYIEALGLDGAYLDVGGFVGTHALFFARYCRADHVHSFEPRPACFAHLDRNVQANGLDARLTPHQLGLSDRDEQVAITIAGHTDTITCRPLDQVIGTRVSVIKLDVEGMEAKVLAGATRILRHDKPLVLIEAHTREELDADLAILAPYGYQWTGRVFNASATYELAAADSPTAGADRLPSAISLLDTPWEPDEPALTVARTAAGLRVVSTLAADVKAQVTQPAVNPRRAPAEDLVDVSPTSTYFVQATGHASDGLGVAIVITEYDDLGRLDSQRHYFHPRLFQRLALSPGTRRIRVSIRLSGPGELVLDGISLHVVDHRTSPRDLAALLADHVEPGAIVVDRTTPSLRLHDLLAGLGAAGGEGAPLALVVQDLPSITVGRAARKPLALDATLAPRVVHVVLCDDIFTILDRGVLTQAAAAGWALIAADVTTHPALPLALAFSPAAGPNLALANERRFAELVRASRDIPAP